MTTCCQRPVKAFLQLGARLFRSPQRDIVAHGLFLQPFVTFGNQSGQRRGMLGGQTIGRVLKFAASVFMYARGFGQVGAEPLNILVRRRTCLPEALVLGLTVASFVAIFALFVAVMAMG